MKRSGLARSFGYTPHANPSVVFFCHIFCTYPFYSRLSSFTPLQVVSHCSITQAKKQAASNRLHRHPLRQKKNNPKLSNITASYGTAA
jgi:hypothetical protein